jgi:N-acetylglucosamine kinase-like BadF-type ATPase
MEGMKAIVRAADGRLPPSPLNAAVLEALSVAGPRELISSLRDGTHDRSQIAALAPLLLDAARAGDPVAAGIAARGAAELVSLAVVVARALKLDHGSPPNLISFVGGLLEGQGDYFRMVSESFVRELPAMQVHRASQPPVGGAIALAIARIDKPLDQQGWDRMRVSSAAVAG